MILLTLIVLPSLFSIWKIPVHPLKLYSRVTLFVMPLLDLSRNKLLCLAVCTFIILKILRGFFFEVVLKHELKVPTNSEIHTHYPQIFLE